MNVEELREYCIGKRGVTEEFPFDDVTLVMKVSGKMFAIIPLDEPELSVSLKCDPERAIELRERFPDVRPGVHLNKKHWNTVFLNGSILDDDIKSWIDDSYDLVVKKLTKKEQANLAAK